MEGLGLDFFLFKGKNVLCNYILILNIFFLFCVSDLGILCAW